MIQKRQPSGYGAAVRSCEGKVHLLAGGLLKESDLTFVKEILVEKVSRLYVFGESAFKMQAAWGDAVACSSVSSMEEAFELACKSSIWRVDIAFQVVQVLINLADLKNVEINFDP